MGGGMVLNLGKRTDPDPYLTKPVRTERFDLVSCTTAEALKITLPWASNPDILHNLMYDKPAYTRLQWVKAMGKPDGRHLFYHAIVAREIKGTIGAHRIRIDRSGTAAMSIVLTAKSWWGKGVFEEVRTGLMDHFSGSPDVMRFAGRVLSRNVSSIYNYQKLGFRLIGYDRKSWLSPVTGEHADTMYFEYLAEDWRETRGLVPA
ncbi:MAG: GNAT family N-acetyltransferase [Silicimonas sp.]|jgi:RimJ/RimL family protein N-acetyltransferase|nr:GNAT family N-acetyltransferase [Silicimonas sp.]